MHAIPSTSQRVVIPKRLSTFVLVIVNLKNAEREYFYVIHRNQESFKNIDFSYEGEEVPTFPEVPNDSMFSHSFVELGNYRGSPFVTGSFQTNDTNNNRTEVFNLATNSWDYDSSYDYPYSTL